MNFNKAILLGAMVSAITACGSGSSDTESATDELTIGAPYTGSEQAATLSESNKAAFSDAVTSITLLQHNVDDGMETVSSIFDGVYDTLDELAFSDEEPPRMISSSVVTQELNATSLKAMTRTMRDKLELQATAPAGIAVSETLTSECGGTVTATGDISETEADIELGYTYEYSVSATLTFKDFCSGRNGEFSNDILNGTVTIEESETETNESYSYESSISINNLEIIDKDIETGDVLDSVILTARLKNDSNNDTDKMTFAINLTTDDNTTASFTLSQNYNYSVESSSEMSLSVKAANGKTYKTAYMMRDEFIFEPTHGYALVSDNSIRSCSDSSEGPGPLRMILEAEPTENVEGYTGSTTLEDEAGNTLVITYGSEESPCSLEPTSVEFTLATISEAPLEEVQAVPTMLVVYFTGKIEKAALIALLFLFCINIAAAGPAKPSAAKPSSLQPYSTNTLHLALAAETAYYQEFDQTGQQFNEEKGLIPNLSLIHFTPITQTTSLVLELGLSHGYVTYTGQLQNGKPYNTVSRMTLKEGALYFRHQLYSGFSFALGYGAAEWDRHILSRGNIKTLSEFYDWQRIIFITDYRNEDARYTLTLERLINAGLDVDLRPWNRNMTRVAMPDGLELGSRVDLFHKKNWYSFIDLSFRHFDRGPASIDGTSSFTEPENLFVQFKLGIGRSF